ncbi:MAG TPA: LysR substrate-binding domain-containing protein [Burkholderiales bacterium]|nr:LysR substrate-binding domain-containing protein [Burkholderiales bacterium]
MPSSRATPELTEFVPLNGLRVFSVVGRLLSFSGAARELHVTPSAVSHQIKALESYLGVRLLRRSRNTIALTQPGRRYLAQISENLMQLTHATKALRATKGQEILKVAAPSSLLGLWLIPRIQRFMAASPATGLALTAVNSPPAVIQNQFDVVFWYGEDSTAEANSHPLCDNEIFPICSPSLVHGATPLRQPSDLRHFTLFDSTDDRPGWHDWFKGAHVPEIDGTRYMNFTPKMFMQQAVSAGLGIGLTRTLLAAEPFARGELVCPFGPTVPIRSTYHLLHASNYAQRKDLILFRDWVLAEAKTSRRQLAERLGSL